MRTVYHHHHQQWNIFQDHLAHQVRQELKVISVRLDIMVSVKLAHLDKTYVRLIRSYFIHVSVFSSRVYPEKRYVHTRTSLKERKEHRSSWEKWTKRGTMQRLIFKWKEKFSFVCVYDDASYKSNPVKAFIRRQLMFPPASVSFIVIFALIFDCMFLLLNALNGWSMYLL